MAVRSRRLFGPTPGGSALGPVTLYVVPVARTAIIKCLTLVGSSGTNIAEQVLLNGSAIGNQIYVTSISAGQSQLLLPYWVLNPGDVLSSASTAAVGATLAGFGSLLLGAPV